MKKAFFVIFTCTLILITTGFVKQKIVEVNNHTIESDFSALPDASINFKRVAQHYKIYPERWNAAFKFLIETNLKELALGRIDLNKDVYVAVSEYKTKDLVDTRFESHKKYIDLQYVVSGEEYIQLKRDTCLLSIKPYNDVSDIEFFQFEGGKNMLANPNMFYIFFPEDYHRPGIRVSNNITVKKIVIKIKL